MTKNQKIAAVILCIASLIAVGIFKFRARQISELTLNSPDQRFEILRDLQLPSPTPEATSQDQFWEGLAQRHHLSKATVMDRIASATGNSDSLIRSSAFLLSGDQAAAILHANKVTGDSKRRLASRFIIAQAQEELFEFENALETRTSIADSLDEEKAPQDWAVAQERVATLMIELGRFAEARPLFEKAVAKKQSVLGESSPDLVHPLCEMALCHQYQDNFGEAESLFRRALAIATANSGGLPSLGLKAEASSGLADLLVTEGKAVEAEALCRETLQTLEGQIGSHHPDLAKVLLSLASSLENQRKLADAETACRRSAAICEAKLGANNPRRPQQDELLAAILRGQNKPGDAEMIARKGLERSEGCLGTHHYKTAFLHNCLADSLMDQEKFGESESFYRLAIAGLEKTFGKDNSRVSQPLYSLANLLQNQGKLADASPLYERALKILEAKLGDKHPSISTVIGGLAQNLEAKGSLDEAERLFRRAATMAETSLGKDHPFVGTHLSNLSSLLRRTKRPQEAEDLLRRAIEIGERQGAEVNGSELGTWLSNLSLALQDQGKFVEAEPVARRALELTESARAGENSDLAIRLNNLALVLTQQKKLSEAEDLYTRAISISEKQLGATHINLAFFLNNLASIHSAQNHPEKALPLLRRQLLIVFTHRKANGSPFAHEDDAIEGYASSARQMGIADQQIKADIKAIMAQAGL
jgi:tetratricopeptide (TPR) repeat protein